MKYPKTNYRLRVFLIFGVLTILAISASAIRQRAATAQMAGTVTTNKSDYHPGETVIINGSGWQPGETVTITIVESDGYEAWQIYVEADYQGNFSNSAFVIQDDDLGVSFELTAIGGSSAQTAVAKFTDGPQPDSTPGKVTVTSNGGSCVVGTAPQGNGPFNWEVVEGGSYTMTINEVTDCDGESIKVFIQNSQVGNFCIVLNKTAPNTYSGQFTMPNPACFTSPISYKCDANAGCDNADTINARGPNGEGSVHLRANTFTDGCASRVVDDDCAAPTPSPSPSPSPREITCTLKCPDDVQVECGASTEPEATGTPIVDGECTATHNDFFVAGCGNTGVITRVWKVTDEDGQETVCSQKITIVDTTAPTIGNPGPNGTIECPNQPVFTPPNASDSCGTATVIEDSDVTTPGSCANAYSRTKTWHAEDSCGNKSGTVSQTIAVVDTTPPQIGSSGSDGVIYCPTQPVFTPPAATDGCSTAIVSVVSDVTTPGTCGTYMRTITWQATDACGNLSATETQTIEVRCNTCGEGTIGFWQNKNGQALITGAGPSSGTCNLTPYLRGYNPYADLSATATCSQVASYVTTVVKAASSAGTSMNSMLKAQMLSTALDVYFGKVLGSANIDLTYINKPIGSASYENVSSSFNGANCLSITGMLSYAASRSNAGGSVWYNQVKTGPNSQELAKDAFDAINNQKAFSVFSCP